VSASSANQQMSRPAISGDQALSIAQLDAERAYGDVSRFRAEVTLETDGWHVEYQIKSTFTKGGAPQYIIDATTGEIISKRYFQ